MTSFRENGASSRVAGELEQRVLTHERSLKAFIASLSLRAPTLAERLRNGAFSSSRAQVARKDLDAADHRPNDGLGLSSDASDGVRLKLRHGIWQVSVDGTFRGHYHQKDHALAALADARQELR